MNGVKKTLLFHYHHLDRLLILIVAIGALLRIGHLGNSNLYYTATVSSMLRNLHNFLYASFDPVGIVMVDKPPLAFWLQSISGAIFGVDSWSVTFPQAIIGTIAIVVVFLALNSVFGRMAALCAAAVLAILPASVAIDSGNEPDSLLSLILLFAAISIMISVKKKSLAWMVVFGFLMGLGFNTKMLVAFIPLPAFVIYYLLASSQSFKDRIYHITIGILVAAVVSIAWILLVAFTPPEDRPYVGSSPDNSIVTLTLKYNGINRFTSFIGPRPRPNNSQPVFVPRNSQIASSSDQTRRPQNLPTQPLNTPIQPPPISTSQPVKGLTSLFSNPLAGQLGWLLPLGLVSMVITILPLLSNDVYRNPKIISRLFQNNVVLAQSILWVGWFVLSIVVFGLASATVTHPYYLVGVSVPLAAVLGIGFSYMFETIKTSTKWSWVIIIVVIFGLIYQISFGRNFSGGWPVDFAIMIGGFSVLVLVVGLLNKFQSTKVFRLAFFVLVFSVLVIPLGSSVFLEGKNVGRSRPQPPNQLVRQVNPAEFAQNNFRELILNDSANKPGLVGTVNARDAAPLIIGGIPAVSIGGFSGNDRIFTIESFLSMAASNDLRYFVMPSGDRSFGPGRGMSNTEILDYIGAYWKNISVGIRNMPVVVYRNPDLQ